MTEPHPDRQLSNAADQLLVAAANRYYEAGEWDRALPLFEAIDSRNRAVADLLAVPLALAHCRIELASQDALDALALPALAHTGTDAEIARAVRLHIRIVELCNQGAFAPAARLLRLIAPLDPLIDDTYRLAIAPGATDCARLGTKSGEPAFVAACGLTDARVAALRQRFAGTRVLLLTHHFSPGRKYEIADYLVASAGRFGFEVREIPVPTLAAGDDDAVALLRHITDFKPQLVVFEEFPLKGFSEAADRHAEQIHTVLRTARASLGVKVVRCDADSWYPAFYAPAALYAGLGDHLDLIQHHHVPLLADVPPGSADAVFCCPFPAPLPEPDARTAGTLARGCFIGSIHNAGISRLVWWAESGVRGLPIDFRVTTRLRTDQMSDDDYVRLIGSHAFALNFTRRGTSARTLTMRSIEVPMAGGVLVEEQSPDTAYFMAPGVHFLPFATFEDLAAVTEGLMADAPRRRRMAADAQAWVRRYFAGDYFWAGILARLWD